MKIKLILPILLLSTILFSGCAKKAVPTPAPTPSTDVVTTASIVNTGEAFEKAIASNGTWIIAILEDLTIDKDLVLEGDFNNNKGDVQRKIALYEQDDQKNITKRFTLTAPKLTINSPAASIQHGIFNGDLEVLTADFQLIDTKVNGNILFANEAAMSGFKMDADSAVSGEQKLK